MKLAHFLHMNHYSNETYLSKFYFIYSIPINKDIIIKEELNLKSLNSVKYICIQLDQFKHIFFKETLFSIYNMKDSIYAAQSRKGV